LLPIITRGAWYLKSADAPLRPMRRCKQLSPGNASLGDGPWPFGLQKQSELIQVSFLVQPRRRRSFAKRR
jgi:hypothetical protein